MAYGRYTSSITGQTNNQSAVASMYTVVSVTARNRLRIYDWMSGCAGTPADQAVLYQFQRISTLGTASVLTAPQALDPADPATSTNVIAQSSYTTYPAFTANAFVLSVSQNVRATFRWVAAPDGELVCASAAASGLGVLAQTVTATAANWSWTTMWQEGR